MRNEQNAPGHIMIVGAGLGDLALAQGLTATGIPVTVYERDDGPDARPQGFRISLNAIGRNALAELLPAVRRAELTDVAVGGVGTGFAFASGGSLNPLIRFPITEGGAVTVRRGPLRRLLIRDVRIEWGRRLVAVEEIDGAVQARFDDGTFARGALLVGADGAGSVTRSALPSPAAPTIVPAGIVTVGGHVTRNADWDRRLPLNGEGAVQYLGPGGHCLFVSFCERDDAGPAVLWALSWRSTAVDDAAITRSLEGADGRTDGRAELHTDAVRRLSGRGWHPVLRALIGDTRPESIIEPLVFRSTRLPRPGESRWWPSGRVTLLGDAAHVMPPLRGLGGNTALADAADLAKMIISGAPERGGAELAEATAEYERTLLARARPAVEDTMETVRLCHLRNPFAVGARTAGLRIAGLVTARSAARSAAQADAVP